MADRKQQQGAFGGPEPEVPPDTDIVKYLGERRAFYGNRAGQNMLGALAASPAIGTPLAIAAGPAMMYLADQSFRDSKRYERLAPERVEDMWGKLIKKMAQP